MDEQPHVRILQSGLRHWWIVLIAVVVTTALTIFWVSSKPAVFKSAGTYVIQARSGAGDDNVRALEALIRSAQINSTYALIARSDAVRDPAIARLDAIPPGAHPSLDAEAMTGTNALTISATARDAEIAQALAVAAGVETIAYVKAGDEPYDLVLLDAPELPSSPANSKKSLTVAIGALLGLMLGLAIATMVDRADSLKRSSRRRDVDTDPTDPAQIRALSAASESEVSVVVEATSDPRVHRDIAEALDRGCTYSLGVLKIAPADVNHNGNGNGNGSGARYRTLLRDHALPNGRTLAHVRDGLFAVVLPDLGAADADKLLGDWVAGVEELDVEDGERGAIQRWIAIVECGATTFPVPPGSSSTGATPNTFETRSMAGSWSWSTDATSSASACLPDLPPGR